MLKKTECFTMTTGQHPEARSARGQNLREIRWCATMSSMKRVGDQSGSAASIVTIGLLVVALLAALGFSVWSYGVQQDYKNNVDSKIAAAVQQNTQSVKKDEAVRYAEEAKNPLKTYTGSEAYGSLHLEYPKTWSAYVVSNTSQPLDAYFSPGFVPEVGDDKMVFALRAQIVATSYSVALNPYKSLQSQGKVTVTPYALPQTPKAVGVRIDGQITQTRRGSIVMLPVRDKTLKLWIESDQYLSDFNTNILPKARFSP